MIAGSIFTTAKLVIQNITTHLLRSAGGRDLRLKNSTLLVSSSIFCCCCCGIVGAPRGKVPHIKGLEQHVEFGCWVSKAAVGR